MGEEKAAVQNENMKSLKEQLNSARRERAMRIGVYPREVKAGRMKQAVADHELACIEAIIATLEKMLWLEEASTDMIQRERERNATSEK
jgi:hypothetical protein